MPGKNRPSLQKRRPTPLQAFENEAKQIATENGYLIGSLQTSQQSTGDLFDDGCTIPYTTVGKAAQKLKEQFLERLAETFTGHPAWAAGVMVMMKENEQARSVDIFAAPFQQNTAKNTPLIQGPAILSDFANHISGIRKAESYDDGAEKALWNLIHECYRSRLLQYVTRLGRVFESHKTTYEGLVTKFFGALEEVPSELDDVLGGHLMMLHSQGCTIAADKMMKVEYEAVIHRASLLLRQPHFSIRLKPLLNKATFSDELFECICLLARPQWVFDIVVRTARVFPTFGEVKLHCGLPSSWSAQPATTSPPCSQPRFSPKADEKVEHIPSRDPATESTGPPEIALFKAVRSYLPAHERSIGVCQLEPKEKQITFLLAAAVLHGQNPDPEWEAYYAFGYPTCRSDDERQALGGIYKALLTDCGEKSMIFSKIWKALRDNNLIFIMDRHGYDLFRAEIPYLEVFLKTAPANRETVWTLVQFVRADKNTDPPPLLQSDYGFELCKTREHVALLKEVYVRMLDVFHPLQIHKDCTVGRLLAAAMYACPQLQPEVHRFLRPNSLGPGAGYVGSSRALSKRGFFRNPSKGFTAPQPTEQ
ncbi:hypothetical protein K458DRAFT_385000 [Lentithecium fluviatile CBS 122367]|uniref:Uncharacterized protein n=1 Tax=Lentithecium fluviatile CBS 122367 TaxID=1168545 RepID=A0A6G1JE41_9PLEO|nr:hypothetical protein K458DRAFT_385000 [Lentithecium fluviatile CBS 122367]